VEVRKGEKKNGRGPLAKKKRNWEGQKGSDAASTGIEGKTLLCAGDRNNEKGSLKNPKKKPQKTKKKISND